MHNPIDGPLGVGDWFIAKYGLSTINTDNFDLTTVSLSNNNSHLAIETKPIKGTLRRGKSVTEDKKNAEEAEILNEKNSDDDEDEQQEFFLNPAADIFVPAVDVVQEAEVDDPEEFVEDLDFLLLLFQELIVFHEIHLVKLLQLLYYKQ